MRILTYELIIQFELITFFEILSLQLYIGLLLNVMKSHYYLSYKLTKQSQLYTSIYIFR